jgi:hypothetical protein
MIIPAACDRIENLRRGAGLIRHAGDGDLRLLPLDADAADDDIFHAHGFLFHNGAGVLIEAAAHFEDDFEFLCELDGARLHHLRAAGGHLQHLVVADLVQLARCGNDARITGEDALHVRVDLANVGLDRCGDRDRCEVAAAAAQGGDLPLHRLPLKARDDHDVAVVEKAVDLLWRKVRDLRLGVHTVGDDPRLCTGERHRLFSPAREWPSP